MVSGCKNGCGYGRVSAGDRSSVNIRFLKDDEEMIAGLQMEKKDKDTYYAYLTLDSSMIRYASDRYLTSRFSLKTHRDSKFQNPRLWKRTVMRFRQNIL